MKLKTKIVRAAKARRRVKRHLRRCTRARLARLKRWGLLR